MPVGVDQGASAFLYCLAAAAQLTVEKMRVLKRQKPPLVLSLFPS